MIWCRVLSLLSKLTFVSFFFFLFFFFVFFLSTYFDYLRQEITNINLYIIRKYYLFDVVFLLFVVVFVVVVLLLFFVLFCVYLICSNIPVLSSAGITLPVPFVAKFVERPLCDRDSTR